MAIQSFQLDPAASLDEHEAAGTSVDFGGQQAITLVIENKTEDPTTPPDGQIWLRTDL